MREIKFKAITDSEVEVEGYYIDGEHLNLHLISNGKDVLLEIDRETVRQYIGIKDIHQKKIFEGDIVQFVWYSDSCWGEAGTYRGYIRFNEGVFELVYIDRKKRTTDSNGYWRETSESDGVQSLFSWSEEIEVIGNIYENPEMKEE